MQRLIILFVGLLLLGPKQIKGAEPPISLSFFNQSWAFPLSPIMRFSGALHPGISVGTEFLWRNRGKNQWLQTVEAGGYLNRAMGSALFAGTETRYRRLIGSNWSAEAGLGLGYFHNFSPNRLFRQEEDGSFSSQPDRGKPGSLISISLGLGRNVRLDSGHPIRIFMRYQWMAASPFTDLIPIRPTGLFHLGISSPLSTSSS